MRLTDCENETVTDEGKTIMNNMKITAIVQPGEIWRLIREARRADQRFTVRTGYLAVNPAGVSWLRAMLWESGDHWLWEDTWTPEAAPDDPGLVVLGFRVRLADDVAVDEIEARRD